jgi:hypothetical protein
MFGSIHYDLRKVSVRACPFGSGYFQGTFHFRHSFIVTGSFLAALHPPHASWFKLVSTPYG